MIATLLTLEQTLLQFIVECLLVEAVQLEIEAAWYGTLLGCSLASLVVRRLLFLLLLFLPLLVEKLDYLSLVLLVPMIELVC